MLLLYKNGKSKDNKFIRQFAKFATKDGILLMIKTLVIMLMAMMRMVLQLNLKL